MAELAFDRSEPERFLNSMQALVVLICVLGTAPAQKGTASIIR